MINKNDLRYQKTEIAIKNAYKDTVKKKKVTVSDICKKAMINHSTFYSHYADIYELKDIIQNEILDNILDSVKCIDKPFFNNELFYRSFIETFYDNKKKLLLYFDNDSTLLVNKIEQKLLNRYLKDNLSIDNEILIRFIIGGASHILITDFSTSVVDKTIDLIKKIS